MNVRLSSVVEYRLQREVWGHGFESHRRSKNCLLEILMGYYGLSMKRELQIHAMASLIKPGDPFSIDPDKRNDESTELGQFAVQYPKEVYGTITKNQVMNSMCALGETIVAKLRTAGALRQGE